MKRQRTPLMWRAVAAAAAVRSATISFCGGWLHLCTKAPCCSYLVCKGFMISSGALPCFDPHEVRGRQTTGQQHKGTELRVLRVVTGRDAVQPSCCRGLMALRLRQVACARTWPMPHAVHLVVKQRLRAAAYDVTSPDQRWHSCHCTKLHSRDTRGGEAGLGGVGQQPGLRACSAASACLLRPPGSRADQAPARAALGTCSTSAAPRRPCRYCCALAEHIRAQAARRAPASAGPGPVAAARQPRRAPPLSQLPPPAREPAISRHGCLMEQPKFKGVFGA